VQNLITELRRRSVFRSAGLYVGIGWVVIEASDILLPVFEAPDWVFKGIIVALIAGFPVAIGLAWYYEFTTEGIQRDEEAAKTHAAPKITRRHMDFVVMGVLAVALGFSLYANFREQPGSQTAILDPVSILIANFSNNTGEQVFAGALEQALAIGLEGAPFITTYPRDTAKRIAEQIKPGSDLDSDGARLVAVREGIELILEGGVVPDGTGYELTVSAVSSETGEQLAEASVGASSKTEVLGAIGKLANQVRRQLGDVDIGETSETFTAGSLEAAHAYIQAQEFAVQGDDQRAVELYSAALAADPNFGRAYSGWAVSASKMGQDEVAAQLWAKALEQLDGMTEREKYRTLGGYYMSVAGNYDKAIENYGELVKRFPADGAGYNNLAVAYFMTLRFDQAREAGRRVMEIYPKKSLYRANFALYAMYAGDFETAMDQARKLLQDDPGYYKGYLPLAVGSAIQGALDEAVRYYEQMALVDAQGASTANLGQSDLLLFRGKPAAAADLLAIGIEGDIIQGMTRSAVAKQIALAQAQQLNGDAASAGRTLATAVQNSPSAGQLALLAMAYLELGDIASAEAISTGLAGSLQSQPRAWGHIVQGEVHLARGDSVDASKAFLAAKSLADMWLGRLGLGKAYLAAGAYAEALAEFELCERRSGEAAAILLDDRPSLRFLNQMPYWKARAQQGLGMLAPAKAGYQAFLQGREAMADALSEDARLRLQAL